MAKRSLGQSQTSRARNTCVDTTDSEVKFIIVCIIPGIRILVFDIGGPPDKISPFDHSVKANVNNSLDVYSL